MIELLGDPWSWPDIKDLDDQQINDLFRSAQFFQYFAVQRCRIHKVEIEKTGSGFAVLAAVRECGSSGLAMPEWLVCEFNRRHDAVLNFHSTSWDDPLAFGKPYPKGTTLAAKRKAKLLSPKVWNAVNQILKMEPNTPIDKGLFERVGENFAIGGTLAESYYYAAKKKLPMLSDEVASQASIEIDGYTLSGPRTTAKNTKSAGIKKHG